MVTILIHIRTLRQKSHYFFVSYKFVCLYASQQYSIIYEYIVLYVRMQKKVHTLAIEAAFLSYFKNKAKDNSLFTLFFYNLNFPLDF
jgi:hypothetical protein